MGGYDTGRGRHLPPGGNLVVCSDQFRKRRKRDQQVKRPERLQVVQVTIQSLIYQAGDNQTGSQGNQLGRVRNVTRKSWAGWELGVGNNENNGWWWNQSVK